MDVIYGIWMAYGLSIYGLSLRKSTTIGIIFDHDGIILEHHDGKS